MNKNYRTVWNDALGVWVAVSEIETSKGKPASNSIKCIISQRTEKETSWKIISIAVGIALGVLGLAGQVQAASVNCESSPAPTGALVSQNIVCQSVGGNSTLAAGTGQSVILGNMAHANDQSIAIGANVNASGPSSIAIGNDDLDKAANTGTGGSSNDVFNNTDAARKYRDITGDYLVDLKSRYSDTKSGVAAVAVGVRTNAADLALGFGTRANASGTASVALGTGATASRDGAVALGAGSNTLISATEVINATVNGISYDGFAGVAKDEGNQVSVGSDGFERQIKNVAAGEITKNSTDAINGSQLYSVVSQQNGQIKAVAETASNALQNFTTSVNGSLVETIAQDNTDINFVNGTGTTASISGKDITFNVNKSGLTVNNAGNVTANTVGDNFATAADVAKAINQATELTEKTTTAQNTDGNVSVVGTTTGNNTDYVINLAKDITVDGVTADEVTADTVTTGDTTINTDGLKVGDVTVTNAPVTVNGATVNNINDAINQTSAQAFNPLTFAGDSGDNVTRKLGETVTVKGGATDTTKLSDGNIGVVANGSDTLDIKLAKDITVDSVTAKTVTAGDTTINNDGLTITDGPTITKEKVDVAGNKITNVANGTEANDAVNLSQLENAQAAATTKVKGDQGVDVTSEDNADGSKTYTVVAKTDGVTTEVNPNGNIAVITGDITTDDKGNVSTTMPNAVATTQTVADAINASGFTAKANGDSGEFISSGDEVNFIDGKNINITRDGANFTVATVDTPVFNTVQIGGDTGPIISNDGNNIKVGDKDGNATKITNVANGEGDNDAVNMSQLKNAQAAATTKVKGDQGVDVTSEDNADGSKTYTVVAKTDGVTTEVNPNGNIAVITGDITTDDKGNVSTTMPNALATAQTVTDAINNSGFTLTAQGENGSLVKPGAIVDMKNTDNNIVIGKSADSNDVVYNLAKNITVDSVKAGNTTINNDGVTINNGPSFTKDKVDVAGNKITNVADGDISATSKDAVNGSQLHNAINNINTNVKAAKTEVTSQDKTVTIKEATNANGGAVYDLAVNTDGTTITTNKDGQITANTINLTNTPDGKVAEPTNPNSLVNAGDITKAINNSGFNIQTNGGDKELVKTGETVNFVNGDNIQITNDGKNITVATAKDVKFDSVNVGDTVNITDKGIDVGNTAITNVKAGTADTDAVNVGQLNDAINNINVSNNNTNKLVGDDGTTRKDVTSTITNPDGTTTNVTVNNVAVDKDDNPLLVTYNVEGQTEYITNSVVTAVQHMNDQGIKFFHTNDGVVKPEAQRQNSVDSSASGAYATAVGYQSTASGDSAVAIGSNAYASSTNSVALGVHTNASGGNTVAIGVNSNAAGKQSIAIGDSSQAVGLQSIAIGTGNLVSGNNSGAIGDPTVVTGDSSYSVGNNNTISTNNTYALGSDITATVGDSVFLGDKSSSTGVHTTADGGNYTYAGANDVNVAGVANSATAPNTAPVGVVSVGTESGQTRQVQNVAAGVVSADSTDAINGSQLYYTNEAITNLAGNTINMGNQLNTRIDDVEDDANAGVSSAMAMAALPQAYLPGKSMLTGGMATYNGEGAVAVGFSKLSDNGRWVLKMSGSADTQGNAGAAVGAGFHF